MYTLFVYKQVLDLFNKFIQFFFSFTSSELNMPTIGKIPASNKRMLDSSFTYKKRFSEAAHFFFFFIISYSHNMIPNHCRTMICTFCWFPVSDPLNTVQCEDDGDSLGSAKCKYIAFLSKYLQHIQRESF